MNGISAARNAILALLLLLGALPALPAAQAAEPPEKAEIERLIEQMGASDYGQREAAQKKLLRIGRPAYDLLKAALDAEDAEVRLRAQNLCGWLEPLRGLNSPDPQKRLEASEAVCQQARELVEADPLVALKMLQSAAEVNPEILRFAPVKETAEALFVLAFAIFLCEPGRPDSGSWARLRFALPLLALAGGIFFSYSFAGLAWPKAPAILTRFKPHFSVFRLARGAKQPGKRCPESGFRMSPTLPCSMLTLCRVACSRSREHVLLAGMATKRGHVTRTTSGRS